MLKLHCIFNQISVLPEVTRLVEKTAHKLNKDGKSAKIEDVYKEIRENGYEIDAESVAFAYGQTSGMIDRKNFSSQADLNRFGGAGIKKAIEIANKGDLLKVRLGKSSVNTSIASGIAKTFSTLMGHNDVDKSRLVELQEKLRSAASSMLDKKSMGAKNTKKTFVETLEGIFETENLGATTNEAMKGKLKGTFNTIEEVWDSIKNDVEVIASKIKDPAARSKFMTMTQALRDSSYNLLLGSKQADDVVKQILQEAGFVKEVNSKDGIVKVVDWNKALANQADWKNDFYTVLRNGGFNIEQTNRVIARLEDSYSKSVTKQAGNRLAQIQKNNGLNKKVDASSLKKLAQVRNAGLFSQGNKTLLQEIMGFSIPQDVSDEVSQIIQDFEKNISQTGDVSNKFSGEVERRVRNLLTPYQERGMGKITNALGNYMSIKAASMIVTIGNIFQNISSGINATAKIATTIASTRNPKLIKEFVRTWVDNMKDVSMGGVPVRILRGRHFNDLLQGKGGLSDRWVLDNASGFGGYFKALIHLLPQVFATAADAANGMVIYQSEMILGVKAALKTQGKTGKEANKIIDEIIFGNDSVTGKPNREIWMTEAKRRLANQTGVVDRTAKAGIIADEIRWSDLTKFGLSIDNIKSIMSASLIQKSKDLGHESDVYLSPSVLLSAVNRQFVGLAEKSKQKGNRGAYFINHLLNMGFSGSNLFLGGIGNWAILTAQTSPLGVVLGGVDFLTQKFSSWKSGTVPIYKQKLDLSNSEVFEEQMEVRKGIRSRFERGIYGTMIQGIGYAVFMSMMDEGDGDDDRKKRIKKALDKYIADPRIKRLLDKAAPAILASEISYAYDKKTNSLNKDRLNDSWFIQKYVGDAGRAVEYFTGAESMWDRINTSFKYADRLPTDHEQASAKAETVMREIGGLLQIPYLAWYNTERNEFKVFESGFTPDPTFKDKQKAQFKKGLQNIDGVVDAFLNGMFTMQLYQGFK